MYQRKEIPQLEIQRQTGIMSILAERNAGRGLLAFVDTYGCQQNEADSQRIRGLLQRCGYGIVEGKQERQAVKDVFDFFYSTLIHEEKAQFLPEQIFAGQENNIENYPKDIPYSDMSGNTADEKVRLLEKWIY